MLACTASPLIAKQHRTNNNNSNINSNSGGGSGLTTMTSSPGILRRSTNNNNNNSNNSPTAMTNSPSVLRRSASKNNNKNATNNAVNSNSRSGLAATHSPSILRRATNENNNKSSNKRPSVTIDESLTYQLDLSALLAQFDSGNLQLYNELCMELSKGMLSARMLCDTLTEISSQVANLCYNRHQMLIRACLACNWHQLPAEHAAKYFSLVVMFATTQPHCVSDAIKVLTHALMYVDGEASSLFDGHLSDRELHYHQLAVEAILAILRVIPMASESVITTIISRVPYVKRHGRQQAACVSSMLKLSQLIPDSSNRLLQTVCQRLIQVDVLCSRDQLCHTTTTPSSPRLHHPSATPPLTTVTTTSSNNSSVDVDSECLFYAQLMDVLMYTVFRFMHTLCYPKSTLLDDSVASELDQQQQQQLKGNDSPLDKGADGMKLVETESELNLAAAKNLYTQFLKVFGHLLLSTSATSHSQFVLFYLINLRPAFTEHIIEWLWLRIAGSANNSNPSSSTPANTNNNSTVLATVPQRCAAALYVGSLLARAKYASIELVRATLEVMCGWLHRYLDRINSSDTVSSVTHSFCDKFDVFSASSVPLFAAHRVFYAVCQSVFYVIAFRHGDMVPIPEFLPFLRSLNLERLVTSHLNPLNNCMSSVVRHFSRVMRHYQLVYCNTIIARNRREQLPMVFQTNLGLRRAREEGVRLTFFPFDPYVLQYSGIFIGSNYREYNGDTVLSDHEDDDDDDSTAAVSDDDDDDNDHGDNGDDEMSGIDVPSKMVSALTNTAIELAAFSMSPDVM